MRKGRRGVGVPALALPQLQLQVQEQQPSQVASVHTAPEPSSSVAGSPAASRCSCMYACASHAEPRMMMSPLSGTAAGVKPAWWERENEAATDAGSDCA